jgi:hypothetical protein
VDIVLREMIRLIQCYFKFTNKKVVAVSAGEHKELTFWALHNLNTNDPDHPMFIDTTAMVMKADCRRARKMGIRVFMGGVTMKPLGLWEQ